MNNEIERELGWDDEIEKESEFVLLPEGDYNFTVTKFERARFNGSVKMPPCNQANLELTMHTKDFGDIVVYHTIFLHTKTEGMLSAFFTGIGQKKKGEKLRMNWGAVVGSKGKCKLKLNTYKTNDGEERTNNKVSKFYPYDEAFGSQPTQLQYQAPQQQYQQQQMPFPVGPAAQSGGYTPGKF